MNHRNPAKDLIWGAFVADAASLGLHWIYDQHRISEVAGEEPEFLPPDRSHYEGVQGFYAHPDKRPGDLSHYGHQMLTMLRALAETRGDYQRSVYEQSFKDSFGYGGDFVGFIDHPTGETLDNMARAEADNLAKALEEPFDGDEKTKRVIITKVLAGLKEPGDRDPTEVITEALAITNHEQHLDYSLRLAEKLKGIGDYNGADDAQIPALSKLPPLVACQADALDFTELVESAVRVTNNNDHAVSYGRFVAKVLASLLQDGDLDRAFEIRSELPPDQRALIDKALSSPGDKLAATAEFGMACPLDKSLPSLIHNAANSSSYVDAIRSNILAGGDSCGRGIILGAMMAALHGIGGSSGLPESWKKRLTRHDEIELLINTALPDNDLDS